MQKVLRYKRNINRLDRRFCIKTGRKSYDFKLATNQTVYIFISPTRCQQYPIAPLLNCLKISSSTEKETFTEMNLQLKSSYMAYVELHTRAHLSVAVSISLTVSQVI